MIEPGHSDIRGGDDLYLSAAEWLDALSEGPLDKVTEKRFCRWLEADERHGILLKKMQSSWEDPALDRALASVWSEAPLHERYRRRLEYRRPTFWAGLGTACVLMLAVAVGPWSGEQVIDSTQSMTITTPVAEVRDVALSDGSSLELNADTALAVELNVHRRHILLKRGGAYFDVATDRARPFEVSIDGASVVAVGTQFSVDRSVRGIDVIVYEGAVEAQVSQGQRPVLVRAGERVRIESKGISDVETVDLKRRVDWRSGWIEIADEPLVYLLEQLDRYSEKPLELIDPELADLRVAGRFRLQDTESNLALLSEIHPLDIREEAGRILVQSKSE